jgi:cyclic pyranopterin phosphate synthase
VRPTVDGTLYPCPGQANSDALRPLLRDGIGEADLIAHLRCAVALKPERRELKERPEKIVRFMSATDG